MKKISTLLLCFSSLYAVDVVAKSDQNHFKNLVKTQATVEQFIQNYKLLQQDFEKKADIFNEAGHYDDPKAWIPICVGYQDTLQILQNNKKYKKQFDAQVEEGLPSFDEALEAIESEINIAQSECEKAKQAM